MNPARNNDWLLTPSAEQRGYIQPYGLKELWFHTGTACNLACPFCLEGSKPGDNRLNRIVLADVQPFVEEALQLGVERFSFTGGEPFIVKNIINILHYCLEYRPCLVLTNGTDPLIKRIKKVAALGAAAHPLSFRVSVDYPDEHRHDAGRGAGNYAKAMQGLKLLFQHDFQVSVARQMDAGEDTEAVEADYRALFHRIGLPVDLRLVSFPDFGPPESYMPVPHITAACMTQYQTESSRHEFMCAYSKMVVKRFGKMRVYACTLVDDDPAYDQGPTLREALSERVMLKHHRCYSCFAYGASCSETHN